MEGPNTTEGKEVKGAENKEEIKENERHSEAVLFIEKHRDFFEHYTKGRIKIEPAPKSLETFAFDLETNTIYVNSMFYQKFGFSEEKTIFATLHEVEHFLEKLQILSEEGGEKKFEGYLKKLESSKAYSLLDNCVADIRENRTVVSKTNKGMGELETKIYKEDLFSETNLTGKPSHIQFCEAILREERVPEEQCQVSEDVRQALNKISKIKGLMDIMTNPLTPMSIRLRLMDKYLWKEIVKPLLEKDVDDIKKKKKQEKNRKNKNKGDENNEKDKGDPNKIFENDYTKAEKSFPEAIPLEKIEKAFKEWKENQAKNSPDKADEDYAKKIGVEKEDLQNYRKIVESLEKIKNPETNINLVEELRNLFLRIISKRLKMAQAPKYPVEEGDELVDPAQLVADVKSGNLQPKVWEDTEIKEKKGDRFGEVEITLVCDRSGSMKGQKAEEQRKSAVLLMEVLKDFAKICEEERINIDKALEIKSEIFTFASSDEDKIPLKKMSAELGEAERVNVLKKLYSLSGTTTDFYCLEAINERLDDDSKQKIKSGELKKIVFLFTDGGSNDVEIEKGEVKKIGDRIKSAISNLRDNGIILIGIGLTDSGKPTEIVYAPNSQVVEDVQKLPIVFGGLLKDHLKDI
ncbi:MAG: vWA domain-containing protein [Candidatus Paceibacterota bacterium]|jgi:uncharacterized protein YegL